MPGNEKGPVWSTFNMTLCPISTRHRCKCTISSTRPDHHDHFAGWGSNFYRGQGVPWFGRREGDPSVFKASEKTLDLDTAVIGNVLRFVLLINLYGSPSFAFSSPSWCGQIDKDIVTNNHVSCRWYHYQRYEGPNFDMFLSPLAPRCEGPLPHITGNLIHHKQTKWTGAGRWTPVKEGQAGMNENEPWFDDWSRP